MDMPEPDLGVISRKGRIVARLRAVLPADAVIDAPEELRAYECDALTAYRCPPLAAVLPRSTEEVSRVLRVCWLEVLGVSTLVDSTYISGIDRFAHLVATVMAGAFGLSPDERLRLIATGLVGSVIMTAIRWYLDGQKEPVATLVEANSVLFLGTARQLSLRS